MCQVDNLAVDDGTDIRFGLSPSCHITDSVDRVDERSSATNVIAAVTPCVAVPDVSANHGVDKAVSDTCRPHAATETAPRGRRPIPKVAAKVQIQLRAKPSIFVG